MGDPKKQRKKYDTPRFPWRFDTLEAELNLLGQYGLRNKRELWRHKTMLSKFRGIARSVLGLSEEEGAKLKEQLLNRLKRLGMLSETAELDNVLDLKLMDILERRLQSLVYKKGLSHSIHQARQLIVHAHITIRGRKVTSPGYLVPRDEEAHILYAPSSPLSNPEHPIRQNLVATPYGTDSYAEESPT